MCDDDAVITRELEKYLREYFSSNHLAQPEYACYHSGEALLAGESHVDIAFLDVEMQGISGIHAGAKIQGRSPYAKIFILTSFPDYLDEAMKFQVFRYLDKPLDKNRLFRNVKDTLYQLSINTKPILIETREGIFMRPADELVMVETAGRSIVVHAADRDYLSIQPMKYWHTLLELGSFQRPHHSFVVNLKYIDSFTHNIITLCAPPDKTWTAYLTRRRYQDFRKSYMLYLGAMV